MLDWRGLACAFALLLAWPVPAAAMEPPPLLLAERYQVGHIEDERNGTVTENGGPREGGHVIVQLGHRLDDGLVVADDLIQAVVAALKLSHPYETPAYEVWRLADI